MIARFRATRSTDVVPASLEKNLHLADQPKPRLPDSNTRIGCQPWTQPDTLGAMTYPSESAILA